MTKCYVSGRRANHLPVFQHSPRTRPEEGDVMGRGRKLLAGAVAAVVVVAGVVWLLRPGGGGRPVGTASVTAVAAPPTTTSVVPVTSGLSSAVAATATAAGGSTDATMVVADAGTGPPPETGSTPSGFVTAAAGYEFSCGLRADGTVACWGDNSLGQIDVPGGEYVEVSAGGDHMCGVRKDRTVRCWGRDTDGQADPPGGSSPRCLPVAISRVGYAQMGRSFVGVWMGTMTKPSHPTGNSHG